MRKLILLCIGIFGLFSCEKDTAPVVELPFDYLPLQSGNYWDFELSGKYLVSESHKMNGLEYFEISNNGTSAYYRKQENKVYVREFSLDHAEEMKFDLAAKVNDTWTYGVGEVTLANRNAILTIGEMQVDSCLQFNFHNDNLMDYGFTIWLAPRIGFIQQTCQECFGSSYENMKLLEAKINNEAIEFN